MAATSRPRWDKRRFISLGALFSALALPITGVGDHLARHGAEGPQAGVEWVVAHVVIAGLFVVLAGWHVVLNRRALLKYLRDRAVGSLPSREALAALVLVVGVLVLTVGH